MNGLEKKYRERDRKIARERDNNHLYTEGVHRLCVCVCVSPGFATPLPLLCFSSVLLVILSLPRLQQTVFVCVCVCMDPGPACSSITG